MKKKQSCHVICHQHDCKEREREREKKKKHLSIFDHPSNYEKSKGKSLRHVHLEKIKILGHVCSRV